MNAVQNRYEKEMRIRPHGVYPELDEVREMVRGCMQCGTCSATCPNHFAMDLVPRQMWRLLLFGMDEEVLHSKTIFLCSSCYSCSLRCPRGLPLTEAVAALKRAAWECSPDTRRKAAFYRAFVDNLRAYGRVQEAALMTRYFLKSRNPGLLLSFAGPGLRLLRKGKLRLPDDSYKGTLDGLVDFALCKESKRFKEETS